MVAYACNPSTQEAETGGLWIQDQPGLHSEILSKMKERKKGRKEGGREGGEKRRKSSQCHNLVKPGGH
jgi:hypothetical protein